MIGRKGEAGVEIEDSSLLPSINVNGFNFATCIYSRDRKMHWPYKREYGFHENAMFSTKVDINKQ
jgi:hypothetical protein